MVLLERAHYEQLLKALDKTAELIHPDYGPCDGLRDGACSVCVELATTPAKNVKLPDCGGRARMNRSELLAQWAELAPGECEIGIRDDLARLQFWPSVTQIWRLIQNTVEFRALLLSALIEAIRAREDWSMEIRLDSDGAVEASVRDGARPAHYSDLPEPCDAMLAAYVAALKATAAENIGHDLGIGSGVVE